MHHVEYVRPDSMRQRGRALPARGAGAIRSALKHIGESMGERIVGWLWGGR